ncbi:Hypothetical_protein [Hexamita inflata]|uniref:Hypothetical_protein n=1 Tax=Hexamita inflata TaxID=28002 RepID=A0AA86PKF8_9EUKA|nr:Hypothetical protein HINF_LOCUS29195 [Hexamita inflata]
MQLSKQQTDIFKVISQPNNEFVPILSQLIMEELATQNEKASVLSALLAENKQTEFILEKQAQQISSLQKAQQIIAEINSSHYDYPNNQDESKVEQQITALNKQKQEYEFLNNKINSILDWAQKYQ